MRSPLHPEVDLSGPTLVLVPKLERQYESQVQSQDNVQVQAQSQDNVQVQAQSQDNVQVQAQSQDKHQSQDKDQSQVQVLTLDLTDLDPADVADAVRAARAGYAGPVGVVGGGARKLAAALADGVDLVIVDGASKSIDQIRSVTGTGAVALLRAADPARAAEVWDELEAHDVDLSRVVVEVGPSPDLVADLAAMARSGRAWRIGADLQTPEGPGGAGWQIGCLAGGAGLALATVRNVSPDRVRRVWAVLEALGVADKAVVASKETGVVEMWEAGTVGTAETGAAGETGRWSGVAG